MKNKKTKSLTLLTSILVLIVGCNNEFENKKSETKPLASETKTEPKGKDLNDFILKNVNPGETHFKNTEETDSELKEKEEANLQESKSN